MKDPSEAMQKAIFAKLAGASGVTDLLGGEARIYDKVAKNPDQLVYPFVRIGDDDVNGASNGCFDAWDVTATINIFSRDAKSPRPEVKRISNAIVAALMDEDSYPQPAGFKIAYADLEQARTFFDTDGVTAHGVVVISYRVNDGA